MTHLLDLHLPSKGQLRLRQLQASSSSVSSGFRILLLWFCMIAPMLAVQLYPIYVRSVVYPKNELITHNPCHKKYTVL